MLPQNDQEEEEEKPEEQKKGKKGIFSKMFQATSILSSLSSDMLMKKSRQTINFSDFTCDCQVINSFLNSKDPPFSRSLVYWTQNKSN